MNRSPQCINCSGSEDRARCIAEVGPSHAPIGHHPRQAQLHIAKSCLHFFNTTTHQWLHYRGDCSCNLASVPREYDPEHRQNTYRNGSAQYLPHHDDVPTKTPNRAPQPLQQPHHPLNNAKLSPQKQKTTPLPHHAKISALKKPRRSNSPASSPTSKPSTHPSYPTPCAKANVGSHS